MWRRSVSSRSPSSRASTRAVRRSCRVIVLEQRRDAADPEDRRPLVQADVHVLPRRVVGGRDALDRPADERAQRRGADTRVTDDGRSSASSSASHSLAIGVPNTLPAPAITAGTPTASSASRTSAP